MSITKENIEALAEKAYPKDYCPTGGCSGLKTKDKNSYERQIWIEGFTAALDHLTSHIEPNK